MAGYVARGGEHCGNTYGGLSAASYKVCKSPLRASQEIMRRPPNFVMRPPVPFHDAFQRNIIYCLLFLIFALVFALLLQLMKCRRAMRASMWPAARPPVVTQISFIADTSSTEVSVDTHSFQHRSPPSSIIVVAPRAPREDWDIEPQGVKDSLPL